MKISIEETFKRAIEAHKAGQLQEATEYYTSVIEAQTKHPEANHNLGILAFNAGRGDEALSFFTAAIESNPDIPQFWISMVEALVKLGRLEIANGLINKLQNQSDHSSGLDSLLVKLKSLISEFDHPIDTEEEKKSSGSPPEKPSSGAYRSKRPNKS